MTNITQVSFESHTLNVGTLAVGKESFFTAKLKNSGTSSAVFYVSQPVGVGRQGDRDSEREREKEREGEAEIVVTPDQVTSHQLLDIKSESYSHCCITSSAM